LLKSVLYLNDELNDVAIVGHEPSLSSIINYFLNKPLEKVATGSVTTLEFSSKKWIKITAANLKSAHHRNKNDFKGFKLQ
jgi:phosphohistidine phosphatase SixA